MFPSECVNQGGGGVTCYQRHVSCHLWKGYVVQIHMKLECAYDMGEVTLNLYCDFNF